MSGRQPAVHRTIVVVDVEGFGDPNRTNSDQVSVRLGMYRALKLAFDDAGIPWIRCDREDRGDGVFILIPADVPKSLCSERLPKALAKALRAHNDRHSNEMRIRLRMVLHAGEVNYDAYGVTATSVNVAFRLLDASPLKMALAESPEVLGIIVSTWFYDEVIRHSPASDPGSFQRISVKAKETATLAWIAVPSDPSPMRDRFAPAVDAPVVWGGIPPRNPNFVGREALLRQLHERLVSGEVAAVVPQALHGLGGIGKSQLATEYAYRHRMDFEIIWWVPAERPAQIRASLAELSRRLGLSVPNDVNITVAALLDALRGCTRRDGGAQISSNWLLIYDNADAPQKVLRYLPIGGPGRILVTSRNSQWSALAQPLEVDVFQRVESIELLRRRGGNLSNDEADCLATELGDLPLAIEQVAAWCAETGMAADEYIRLLNEKRAEMLSLPGPLDYRRSVAAAWNLSFEKLKDGNPAALRVLQIFAFFAPEPIPRSMLVNTGGASAVSGVEDVFHDELRLNEAIRDINRYALARIDGRGGSIQLHRLVQAVLISQMSSEEQDDARHGAHLLLARNDPHAPDETEDWSIYGQLYQHFVASDALECTDPTVRALAFNITRFLYHSGEFKASRDMSIQIYDIWSKRLGLKNVDTLKVGRWLGFMFWASGEFERSAKFNASLLDLHRRALGDDHEDTLDAINAVAGDRRAMGDFSGALELSRMVYQRCVVGFEIFHSFTVHMAHNLCVSLRLSGQYAEAKELDLLMWRRKVSLYGPDHFLTLLTQVGLALDQKGLGDYGAANVLFSEIMARYDELFGRLHPATLRARCHLAGMRRNVGDYAGAEGAADKAFEGLVGRYGLHHPYPIAALLSRSINRRLLGERQEARRLGIDALEHYRSVLGHDHPHTLCALTQLAVTLRLLNESNKARDLDQAAIGGLRARLSDDHPSTVIATMNLASDLFALGHPQAAYDLDIVTVARAERVSGRDHPITLAAKANLAQDLRALGYEESGMSLRIQAHRQAVDRFSAENPIAAVLADKDSRANFDIDPMPL